MPDTAQINDLLQMTEHTAPIIRIQMKTRYK